jgi:hypothetical protein
MQRPTDDQIPFRFLGGYGTFNAGASVWLYGFCLLLSLPFIYVFLFQAPWTWWKARGWQPTKCLIVSARMKLKEGTENRYDEEVIYEYDFGGQLHRGDRVRILNFTIRRYRDANEAELQARYPPNSIAECYVNPARPAEALLDRELQPSDFIYVPFVLIIFGVGLFGLVYRWKTKGFRRPKS